MEYSLTKKDSVEIFPRLRAYSMLYCQILYEVDLDNFVVDLVLTGSLMETGSRSCASRLHIPTPLWVTRFAVVGLVLVFLFPFFALPLRTSPSHFPFALPLRTSPSYFSFALPLRTSPSYFPFALPLRTSPSHFPFVLPLRTSPFVLPLRTSRRWSTVELLTSPSDRFLGSNRPAPPLVTWPVRSCWPHDSTTNNLFLLPIYPHIPVDTWSGNLWWPVQTFSSLANESWGTYKAFAVAHCAKTLLTAHA